MGSRSIPVAIGNPITDVLNGGLGLCSGTQTLFASKLPVSMAWPLSPDQTVVVNYTLEQSTSHH